MARNTQLLQARNLHIRMRFRYHRKKNPKWMIEAVIEAVAKDVFLSEVTVVKILKQDESADVPTAPTMSKYNKEKALPVTLIQTELF